MQSQRSSVLFREDAGGSDTFYKPQTISCVSSLRLHCVLTVLCAQKEPRRLVEGCCVPVAACGALINLAYKLHSCPFVIFSTAIAARHLETELGFSREATKQQRAQPQDTVSCHLPES